MQNLLDGLNVSCNWKIINEKKINNAVTVVDSSNKSIDIDDIVTLDSCIALSQPSDSDQLEVTVEVVNSNFYIGSVWIVSEAKVLEIFGRFGEYEGMTNAVNTEDTGEEDEMQVYRAKLAPKTPARKCSVRFAGAAKRNELWLLGMGVILEPCPLSQECDSMAKRVENILLESKVPLSKNAECFKDIVLSQPSFQRESYCSGDVTALNAEKMYLQQFEERIKGYIDTKFLHLEEKIDKRFEEILNVLQVLKK